MNPRRPGLICCSNSHDLLMTVCSDSKERQTISMGIKKSVMRRLAGGCLEPTQAAHRQGPGEDGYGVQANRDAQKRQYDP